MTDLGVWMLCGIAPLFLVTLGIFHRNRPAFIVSLLGVGLYLMAFVTLLFGAAITRAIPDDLTLTIWRGVPLEQSVLTVAIAGTGAVLGALAVAILASFDSALEVGHVVLPLRVNLEKRANGLLLGGAFGIVAYLTIYGWSAVLDRTQYIPPLNIPALGSILGVLGPLTFVLAIVVSQAAEGRRRLIAWLEVATISLIFLGAASRMLALLPLLALVLAALLQHRLTLFRCLGAIILSLIAAASVLQLRSGVAGKYGLHAFIPELVKHGPTVIGEGANATLANVLFAVPLTGAVESTGRFNSAALATSLDPSPLSSQKWAELAPGLRLHAYIPFNAIGELASISPLALFLTMFGFAFITAGLLTALAKRGHMIPFMAVTALFILASVLLLQYNLRSVSRVLYAAWVVAVVALVWSTMTRRPAGATNRINQARS